MSKASLQNQVQKLHLEPGDMVLVRDVETARALDELKVPLGFSVPIIFSPMGVQVLKKQDLLNLLEQLEQVDKSVLEPYHTTDQTNAPI